MFYRQLKMTLWGICALSLSLVPVFSFAQAAPSAEATPIHQWAEKIKLKVLKYLQQQGTTLSLRTQQGMEPLDDVALDDVWGQAVQVVGAPSSLETLIEVIEASASAAGVESDLSVLVSISGVQEDGEASIALVPEADGLAVIYQGVEAVRVDEVQVTIPGNSGQLQLNDINSRSQIEIKLRQPLP